MIFKEEPVMIGHFSKPHGVHGGLILVSEYSFTDEPDWPEWLFVKIEGSLVPFKCQQDDCFLKDNHSLVVFIKGRDNKDLVSDIIGKSVYFPKNITEDSGKSKMDVAGLTGFDVKLNSYNDTGKITDWMNIHNNPLFVIQWRGKELLIPAQNEFVININEKEKLLLLNLPEGLIELE